jgi:hypothetical protein
MKYSPSARLGALELLFFRDRAGTYENALTQFGQMGEDRRAVELNLRNDHRVSVQREDKFRGVANAPDTAWALFLALKAYFENWVRRPQTPDFLVPSLNEENFRDIYHDVWLVRILDLTGLIDPLKIARKGPGADWTAETATLLSAFGTFVEDGRAAGASPSEIVRMNDWIDSEFAGVADPDRQGAFLSSIFEILSPNADEERARFHPTWVARWHEFEPSLDAGPQRWAQVMGLKYDTPRRLIPLKYRARRSGGLVRPTQLDAGLHPYHVPSPPNHPGEGSQGHPMDLSPPNGQGKLIDEYIHQEIPHEVADWVEAGRKVGRLDVQNGVTDLHRLRDLHRALLAQRYSFVPENWLWPTL